MIEIVELSGYCGACGKIHPKGIQKVFFHKSTSTHKLPIH